MLQLTTIFFLIAGTILAVLHIIAIELYLYWRFIWFDIPIHILGGAVVALFLFTLVDLRLILRPSFLKISKVMLAVLLVALAWEAYELFIGVPADQPDFIVDTLTDLAMGLLGGYIGFVVGNNMRKLK